MAGRSRARNRRDCTGSEEPAVIDAVAEANQTRGRAGAGDRTDAAAAGGDEGVVDARAGDAGAEDAGEHTGAG